MDARVQDIPGLANCLRARNLVTFRDDYDIIGVSNFQHRRYDLVPLPRLPLPRQPRVLGSIRIMGEDVFENDVLNLVRERLHYIPVRTQTNGFPFAIGVVLQRLDNDKQINNRV